MKPGMKLKSAVCDTEVMVIRAGRPALLACGGAPLVEERAGERVAIDPAFAGSTKAGKRYQDGEGAIELLCIKAGMGSLSADGIALQIKDAKPLPASD